MAYEKLGVDVIINNIDENPSCTHGPSILFERYQEGGQSRSFYACSACRDRRDCSFFLWAHQKISKNRQDVWARLVTESGLAVSHEDEYKRLEDVRGVPAEKRHYCTSCSTLLTSDEKTGHESCCLISPVTDAHLINPSTLLPPKESSKYEAQYLFAWQSVETMIELVGGLSVSRVLCVGAPRLHETITAAHPSLASLLMDIDTRYRSFFSSNQFVRYNMFNHHFFDGEKAKRTYLNFIGGEGNLAVVTDPPFGGRMELLAHNLMRIQDDWRAAIGVDSQNILPILFIFPYFMESQVLSSLPTFKMLDYQVDYDNHPLYSSGPKGMKNGSAVRIFTNQPEKRCALPESEGYRWCEMCQRWVTATNTHCHKCSGCMSKDGRTYKHCDACGKCVKPSWIHCPTCTRCQPQDHRCRPLRHTPSPTCHKCGATGHKRSQCHKRVNTAAAPEERKKKKKKNVYPQNVEDERTRNLSILQALI